MSWMGAYGVGAYIGRAVTMPPKIKICFKRKKKFLFLQKKIFIFTKDIYFYKSKISYDFMFHFFEVMMVVLARVPQWVTVVPCPFPL